MLIRSPDTQSMMSWWSSMRMTSPSQSPVAVFRRSITRPGHVPSNQMCRTLALVRARVRWVRSSREPNAERLVVMVVKVLMGTDGRARGRSRPRGRCQLRASSAAGERDAGVPATDLGEVDGRHREVRVVAEQLTRGLPLNVVLLDS